MTVQEIALAGGAALAALMTLVQISPIKFDPWSALARLFGRAINADLLKEVQALKTTVQETQQQLSDYTEASDKHHADRYRADILHFNLECVRGIRHTREDFVEILSTIDKYEKYCAAHPEYPNNRAVHAVANIMRVYDERLQKNDFEKEN